MQELRGTAVIAGLRSSAATMELRFNEKCTGYRCATVPIRCEVNVLLPAMLQELHGATVIADLLGAAAMMELQFRENTYRISMGNGLDTLRSFYRSISGTHLIESSIGSAIASKYHDMFNYTNRSLCPMPTLRSLLSATLNTMAPDTPNHPANDPASRIHEHPIPRSSCDRWLHSASWHTSRRC